MATTLTFQEGATYAGGNSFSLSMAIGTAAADRIVVVTLADTGNGSGTAGEPTAVTIGGNAMTQAVLQSQTDGGGNGATTAIYWLLVPTGTTATVAMTWAGAGVFDAEIATYSLVGANTATPVFDTSSNTATGLGAQTLNFDLDTPSGGSVVGTAKAYTFAATPDPTDAVWTGATVDYEVYPFSVHIGQAASASNVASATPRTVEIAYLAEDGYEIHCACAVSFQASNAAVVTYRSSDSQNPGATGTLTYTNMALGAAGSTYTQIFLAITWRATSEPPPTTTGLTVDGVAATLVLQQRASDTGNGSGSGVAIYRFPAASLPVGAVTDVDVVASFSANVIRGSASLYTTASSINTVPHYTASDFDDLAGASWGSLTLSDNTPARGFVIAAMARASNGTGNELLQTWTGLTENNDGAVTGTTNTRYSTASTSNTSDAVPLTITVAATATDAASFGAAGVSVAYAPADAGVIFRSEDHSTYASRTTDVTCNVPAATQDDDIILLYGVIYDSASNTPVPMTPPAGFALVQINSEPLQPDANGNPVNIESEAQNPSLTRRGGTTENLSIYAWWKRASSEGSTYTATFTGTFPCQLTAVAYSGCITTGNPIAGASSIGNADTSSDDYYWPPISTTVANTMVVLAATNFIGGTSTPPTGYTERVDLTLTYVVDKAFVGPGMNPPAGVGSVSPSTTQAKIGLALMPPQTWPNMYVRSTSGNIYSTRNGTLTLNAPVDLTNDDILVLFALTGVVGTPPTMTPPAGFTAFTLSGGNNPTSVSDGSFGVKMWAWWKRAASEGATYTVTWTGNNASNAWLACVRGAKTSGDPYDDGKSNTGTGGTATGLAVSPGVANTLLLWDHHDWGDATTYLTAPSGMSWNYQSAGLMFGASENIAASGTTGNRTMTVHSNPGNPWATFMLSMIPPSAGGGAQPSLLMGLLGGQLLIGKLGYH